MALLDVTGLKFKYQSDELFNSVDFRILDKDHLVLVGDNGAGKSTFMNLIAKNLIPDSGKIEWQNNITFGYLDQYLKIENDVTIEEYLTDAFKELFQKEKQMNDYYNMLATCKEYEQERYLNFAQSISDELEKLGFYQINSTLGNMVNGLGIANYGMDTKLNKLSGGQRAKVYLAKLLLDEKDVLLMDEPTNFLDVSHIEWLAKYLKAYPKAFLVISHDEEFLRQIGNQVVNLSNKSIIRYNMNYDNYLKEKALRDAQYQKAFQNQQKFIKQTQEFINKNIVRATTTKRAQSRRKMLEKISVLDKPKNHDPMNIEFMFSKGLGQRVLELKDLTIGYSESKPVLSNLNVLIKQNEKIAILGHNGVGKSTLLKTIVGELKPLSGEYVWNPSSDINYFAQIEEFDNKVTPIEYLRYFYHLKTDGELRSILARAGIKGDLAIKPMSSLSGGEQTKVRLALMSMKKSNVLIFDEPTNHLDVATKSELWEAIDKFPGSVILVTHEDNFYEGLVDFELRFDDEEE